MRLGLDDLPILDLEVPSVRINAEDDLPVLTDHILHAHHGAVPQTVVVHHESEPGVQSENGEGGVILKHRPLRQDHPIGSAAGVEPLSQVKVLCGLVLYDHVAVQNHDLIRQGLILGTTNILERFTQEVAILEGDDLLCVVFHHLVADFRADFLFTVQDRLLAPAIPVQVVDLGRIDGMKLERLPKLLYHIGGIDHFGIRHQHHSPEQGLAPGKLRRLLRRSCGDSLSRSHTGLSIHGFCHTNTSKHKRVY